MIVPCFNARPYIEATLRSVFEQTHRPLELIVVDDGSTDGCTEWLASASARFGFRVVHQPNRGQTAALNAGLGLASGRYVQFLDADDLIDPDKISAQLQRLEGRDDLVATAAWGRFHDGDPHSARFEPEPCWRDLAPAEWLAAAWHDGGAMMFPALWLVPRRLCDAAGPWNESLSLNNDAEFFVRVLRAAQGVRFAANARARYRSSVPGSLSARVDPRSREREYEALRLVDAHVATWPGLAAETSVSLRRGRSLLWQRFARGAYPYTPRLAEEAFRRGRELDSVRLPLDGGWRFRGLAALLGWRMARRLQVWSGRR